LASRAVGVGNSFVIASSRVSPGFTGFAVGERFAVEFRDPRESIAVGVGRCFTTVRRSGPPSPWFPDPFASEVRGVGRVFSSKPRLRACPFPVTGCVVGVGSKDEQSSPLVAGADVGRSYNAPLRIEPDRGKVGEHAVEPKSKVPCDVLKEHDSGS
jgi:hypothetical protein